MNKKLFMSHVDKNGPVLSIELGSCWIWVGCRTKEGYGHAGSKTGAKYAHRVSWELYVGTIPKGKCVLHGCDNPTCIRPSHLFIGTKKDNYADARSKDRHTRGERHGMAKLTDAIVTAIREEYVRGSKTHGQLALGIKYGVTQPSVHRIVTGKYWVHL